jgi:biofilm PGA synthesis lipoprotein PgaB
MKRWLFFLASGLALFAASCGPVLRTPPLPVPKEPEGQKPSTQEAPPSTQQQQPPTAPAMVPTQGVSARPLRLAQVFRLPEPEALDSFLDALKTAGFDTIAVRAFHHPGDRYHGGVREETAAAQKTGVYYDSALAPVVANVLLPAMQRMHEKGFQVWAWMPTRGAGWDFPNKRDMLEYRYNFRTRQMERGDGLDIFHPSVDSYLRALYGEMAHALPLDGVLLQDDLVLRHDTGFGPYVEMAYFEAAGRSLRPGDLYASVDLRGERPVVRYTGAFYEWKKFQAGRILSLALSLREEVRAARPSAVMALNVYYDSVLMPENGLAWLAQDVENWAKSPMEYFAVMAYHRQIQSELKLSSAVDVMACLAEMRRHSERWFGNGARLLWKLQAKDWESGAFVPAVEIQSMKKVLDDGACSFAVAPVEADWPDLAAWTW